MSAVWRRRTIKIGIRSLAIEDYKALVTLWQRAGLKFKPRGRDSREALRRQLRQGRVTLLGAEKEGRLIGVVMVSHDGRKGWINRLAVDPVYRRQGLGARLIAAAEEELHDQGVEVIAALIEAENEPSLNLFQKEGYLLAREIFYLSKRPSEEA
ncbi:MAG: GNAT family N-acetyltransferase [Anaerolineae bacterium]